MTFVPPTRRDFFFIVTVGPMSTNGSRNGYLRGEVLRQTVQHVPGSPDKNKKNQ